MSPSQTLPAGYSARPLTLDDLTASVDLVNLCYTHEVGVGATNEDDVLNEWGTPGFDLSTDTCAIIAPDGTLAAYAELWNVTQPRVRPYLFARVHPDHTGHGFGTYLLQWAEDCARVFIPEVPPEARVVVRTGTFNTNEAAQTLFANEGFTPSRTFYRMQINMDAAPPEAVWPQGITLRTLTMTDADLRMAHAVSEEVFEDHWGHLPISYDTWLHWIENDKEFDPSLSFLAMDGDTVAGYCFCRQHMPEDAGLAWIEELGVRRAYRRRGLGESLLRHSFGELWRRGQRKVGLGVDASSLTNATRLYQKVGMHVSRETRQFEKELRPGIELSTQIVEAEAAGD